MSTLLLRFLIGGVVVSTFALLGDVLRPKSFAGLFGAAPSIALATLGLTVHEHGPMYAAVEARSMALGAIVFCIYAGVASWGLLRWKPSALVATLGLLPLWLGLSLGLYGVCLR